MSFYVISCWETDFSPGRIHILSLIAVFERLANTFPNKNPTCFNLLCFVLFVWFVSFCFVYPRRVLMIIMMFTIFRILSVVCFSLSPPCAVVSSFLKSLSLWNPDKVSYFFQKSLLAIPPMISQIVSKCIFYSFLLLFFLPASSCRGLFTH